ncbi:hypothetical protein HYDPIDRAFT_116657 [Hydnomerulius pinastri MD-312]|uniref:Uncharacterized protein n=1 Tax=Hydnomerulius pinastri MD-312 TaxID=994086 RepID=A0A0C9WAZ3_9AGAM|nr:hypothetical protein HYDPIDRAFT_116657 [Hydnomerulius pinastri MD-312]
MSDRTSSPDTQRVFTQSVFTVFSHHGAESTHASSYATMGMIHITAFDPRCAFPSSP